MKQGTRVKVVGKVVYPGEDWAAGNTGTVIYETTFFGEPSAVILLDNGRRNTMGQQGGYNYPLYNLEVI